jgi:hypothetical protein
MILATVIPWVAVACVLFLALTLIGAIMSLAALRQLATQYATPGDLAIHSPALIRRLGLAAPVAVPLIFLIFWLVVLTCDFRVHP